MHVDTLSVGPIQTNCYLVTCAGTGKAALIDPGWNATSIRDAIASRRAKVEIILNTHAHFDHIGGNAAFVKETGAPLAIHEAELPLLRHRGGADLWGIPVQPSPEPGILLEPGQVLDVGELRLEVLLTPGHTPGHVSFYEAAKKAVFDGDVLFQSGIGRTDLPGGDARVLQESIRDVLLTLPDNVMVYPGHGPSTTIGQERRHNPWLAADWSQW